LWVNSISTGNNIETVDNIDIPALVKSTGSRRARGEDLFEVLRENKIAWGRSSRRVNINVIEILRE
jgi:hypothetical protein